MEIVLEKSAKLFIVIINASNQIESWQDKYVKKRTYAAAAAAHGMEFSTLQIHLYPPQIQQASIR
jgi:hypothetical protein